MNIRITLSLLIAATCGVACSQAANADEQDVRSGPSMRFDFGSNNYALDHVSPRRHTIGTFVPSSVKSGAAPKNLLGLDPSFVSKPAPMPVARPAAPAPVATVAAKPILPSPFSSIFGHPNQTPLVASAPGALPGMAAPAVAHAGHIPATHATTGLHGSVVPKHTHTPTALAARPAAPVASYGNQFYSPGSVLAGYNNSGGNHVDTALSGSVIGQHKHH